jgi:hypothetical protein
LHRPGRPRVDTARVAPRAVTVLLSQAMRLRQSPAADERSSSRRTQRLAAGRHNDISAAASGALLMGRESSHRGGATAPGVEGPSRLPASTTPPGRLPYAWRSSASRDAVVAALVLAGVARSASDRSSIGPIHRRCPACALVATSGDLKVSNETSRRMKAGLRIRRNARDGAYTREMERGASTRGRFR